MWDKPKEITGYPTAGYEICESGASTAKSALDDWKDSSAHNAVILNEGVWKNHPWKAIGAARCQGYWCVWFGETLDTSKPPSPMVFLKGYDKPKTLLWASDLIAIDPSKVKKLGQSSDSSGNGESDKASPSGSRVNTGVHGRVYAMDSGGTLLGTVSGATIELKGQSGAGASNITSGENGYYRADLQPGKYFYKVTAPGYKDEDKGRGFNLQKTDEGQIYNFWLVKGENDPERKPPVIPVTPVATLKGTVWERTEDGELVGIPRAIVSLRREGSAELAQVTTSSSDADGRAIGAYQIVLAAGSWKASAGAVGFETLVDPEPIVMVDGKEAKRDFVLKRKSVRPPTDQGIKGVVRVDGMRIGHFPEDLKVEVLSVPGSTSLGSPPVDSAGGFRQQTDPGAYRVRAEANGYVPADSGVKYVLPDGYTTVLLRLRKERPETPEQPEIPDAPEQTPSPQIAKVMIKVVGADGDRRQPLPDARVLLRHTEQDLASAQRKTTDASGEATFSAENAGPHVALAQHQGYEPAGVELEIGSSSPTTATIVLKKRPGSEDGPSIEPPPLQPEESEPVEVVGYVVYKDPQSETGLYGVEGARLSWRPLDPRGGQALRVATTGEVGEFRLQLSEGEYEVSFALPGEYLPKQPEHMVVRLGMKKKWFYVEKRPEEEATEPEVEPGPDIAGEFITVRGHVVTRSPRVPGGLAAVGGATVRWHPRHGEGLQPGSAESDSRGRFALRLREGDYFAEVEPPPGYRGTAREVRVQSGMDATTLIVERIQPGDERPPEDPVQPPPPEEQQPPGARDGGLALQVYGRDRGKVFPLGGSQVRIRHGRSIVFQGQTDRAGRLQTRLANGSYEAIAMKDGFNMGRTGVEIRGQYVSRQIYLDRQPGGQPGPPDESSPHRTVSLNVRVMVSFPKPPKRGQPAGFTTAPAQGAAVMIVQGRRTVASGKADGAGNYTARLQPGSYEIRVSHGNLRQQQGVTLQQRDVSRTITLQSGAAVGPNLQGPVRPIEPQSPQRPVRPIRPRPIEGPFKIIPAVPQRNRRAVE